MKNKITNKLVLPILILFCIFIVVYYFCNQQLAIQAPELVSDATSTNITIQECTDKNFGLSIMSVPSENQDTCAHIVLANTKPIKITNQNIGDYYTLSDIKALVRGDAMTSNSLANSEWKTCWKDADYANGDMRDCSYANEESLQDLIRSLVVMNIEKEKVVSAGQYDSDPKLYADVMKTEWQNWYASTINEKSTKNSQCTLEVDRDAFGGSITYLYKSDCFIQQEASEVLWLLDRLNDKRVDKRNFI